MEVDGYLRNRPQLFVVVSFHLFINKVIVAFEKKKKKKKNSKSYPFHVKKKKNPH